MPRYRALAPLFIRKMVAAGTEFESDLPPGRNWEPLDDEARARVAAYRSANVAVLEEVERKDPRPPSMASIEVPADWRGLSVPKRRALAMKFGAQSTVKAEEANSFIEAELERRKQNAA